MYIVCTHTWLLAPFTQHFHNVGLKNTMELWHLILQDKLPPLGLEHFCCVWNKWLLALFIFSCNHFWCHSLYSGVGRCWEIGGRWARAGRVPTRSAENFLNYFSARCLESRKSTANWRSLLAKERIYPSLRHQFSQSSLVHQFLQSNLVRSRLV